ncbi:MAG: TonB-dependent receptor, partial [Deltaproteobacteria bacterium]|nr:TonB-dependent receptor [Deltaproteobacteria bacterium]
LQVSAAQDEQDFFTLSHNFSSGFWQKEGRRVNSDYRNRRLNVIAGLTPTEKIDIMFGTILQDFVKGQPPVAEKDPPNNYFGTGFGPTGGERLWRWPIFRTERYFVNANADLTDTTHVQLVAYLDKHKDLVESFTRIVDRKAHDKLPADSGYNQYTSGIRGRVDHQFNQAHKLSLSVGYRVLSHRDQNNDVIMTEHIKEHYWDLGAEYSYKPIDRLTAVLGLSYSERTPDIADKKLRGIGPMLSLPKSETQSEDIFDWQLGLFYDLFDDHQVFLTYAKKSRFPSMWERFNRSNRNDLLSFDLKPEEADHFELGYRGTVGGWLKFTTSAFYTDVKDKITMISVDYNTFRYAKNLDKVETYGVEAGVEMNINQNITLGGSLSFLDWKVQTKVRDQSLLMNAPKTQGSFYAVVSPMEKLTFTAQANARSSFYTETDPDEKHDKAPGFLTADLKATYDINDYLTAELGARNIFDKDYYYTYYMPQAGRTFFLGLTANY